MQYRRLPIPDEIGVLSIRYEGVEWIMNPGFDRHESIRSLGGALATQGIAHHSSPGQPRRIWIRITQIRQCRKNPFLVQP